MITNEDRMNKAAHDAWYANYIAARNAANIEYIAMMADIEIDEDDEGMTEVDE